MATIGNLIRYIVIVIFISTILEMVLPEGVFRRYLRMLVGILLILTLLTPLQKIMRLAPYWEMPVWPQALSREAEFAGVLPEGEAAFIDSLNLALQEYRSRIFSLLESELDREFAQELLCLELSLEEDYASREFGSLQGIYAAMRANQDCDRASPGEKIERIKIGVEIADKDGFAAEVKDFEQRGPPGGKKDPVSHETAADGADGTVNCEQGQEIENFIAAYFQLPVRKVEVEILP